MSYRILLAALTAPAAATAQCPFTSATMTHISSGCTAGSLALTGSFDPTACVLSTSLLGGFGTAGPNPGAWAFVFALGLQPLSVPLPELGAGCMLLVQPDILVATGFPGFTIVLPPTATPIITFGVQAAALYTSGGYPFPPVTSIAVSERQTTSLHTAQ